MFYSLKSVKSEVTFTIVPWIIWGWNPVISIKINAMEILRVKSEKSLWKIVFEDEKSKKCGHIYHCLVKFCGQNPVISIEINLIAD